MGILMKDSRIIAGIAGAGIAIGAFVINHFWKRYLYWNSNFVQVGTVKDLFLYPIKSGKPLIVEWVDCTINGVQNGQNKDRNFLVVDENVDHLFLTARQYPKLVLLEASVKDEILTVKAGEKEIKVDLKKVVKLNDVRTGILHFKLKQEGYDCGDEVSDLLNEFLDVAGKRKLRLLYFSGELKTERNYTTKKEFWQNPVPIINDYPAYQDLASFMMTTEASVEELNGRLQNLNEDKCVISARNFRPNINIEGTQPFDEDLWLDVKIGEVEFACFKPCTRCVMTTVDPSEGKFLKNMQPLRLLRSYRLVPEGPLREVHQNSPIFGVNAIVKKEGRIHVGDKVMVRYKSTRY